MRYGFGQAFILSERRTNGVKFNNLNWIVTKNTSFNQVVTSSHPWGKRLLRTCANLVLTDEALPTSKNNTTLRSPVLTQKFLELDKLAHTSKQYQAKLDSAKKENPLLPPSDYANILKDNDLTPDSLDKSFDKATAEKLKEVNPDHVNVRSSALSTISDINFLRKEFTYTKLKYSRSPQYDAVSGGFAALLAGFIGFLITEKFGIELVDSGDFFIVFMYAMFVGFTARLLIVYSSDKVAPHFLVSPQHNLTFFKEILVFLLAKLPLRP